MDTKPRFAGILIVFVTLILPCASAEVISFHEQIDICVGASFSDELIIQNDDIFPVAVELSQTGNVAGWSTIIPDFVVLGPRESQTVRNVLDPPSKGAYTSSILIKEDGKSSILEQEVNVRPCPNMRVGIRDFSLSNCPCVTTAYEFSLTNTGSFVDGFSLSVDLPEDQYTLSNKLVTVLPGETLPVYVYITLPCDKYGDFELNFHTYSKVTNFRTTTPFYLQLRRECYDFSLAFGAQAIVSENFTGSINFRPAQARYDFCREDRYVIPFRIDNPGTSANSFQLTSDNRLYDSTDVAVNANSSGFGYLIVQPSQVKPGNITSIITVDSTRGDLSKPFQVDASLIDCSGEPLAASNRNVPMILGASALALLLLIIILLLVIMIKRRKAADMESAVDPADVKLSETKAKSKAKMVKSSETEIESPELATEPAKPIGNAKIFLIIAGIILLLAAIGLSLYCVSIRLPGPMLNETLNGTLNGTLAETVNQTSAIDDFIDRTFNITPNISVTPNISEQPVLNETGTESETGFIQKYKYYIIADALLLALIIAAIIIGARRAGAPAVAEKAVKKPKITTKKGKKEAEVEHPVQKVSWKLVMSAVIVILLLALLSWYFSTVMPGQAENATLNNLSISDPMNASSIVQQDTQVNATSSGNLTISSINENADGSSDAANITQVPETASPVMEYFSTYKYQLLFAFVLFVLILLFVIMHSPKKPKKQGKDYIYKHFLILLGIIFALLLMALLFFTTLRDAPIKDGIISLEENATNYVWRKNTVQEIDFSPYILDEEGDNVTLRVTPVENITTATEGFIIRLMPDQEFSGMRIINIIAEDSRGGRSISPDISLVVLDRDVWYKEFWKGAKAFFSLYLSYIVLIMLAIIIATIILVYWNFRH